MSFTSWRPKIARRSKLSAKCNDAKTAFVNLPSRTLAPISNAIKTAKKKRRRNARISSVRETVKDNKKAVENAGREAGKSLCWLKLKFWKPSRDKVAKELKLTIFSLSASSMGIGSAVVTGAVSPPALAGLVIAVPAMTRQAVKLHTLQKKAGGYRRLFKLIRKREAVVMVVGGLTVGVTVLILCVGSDELEKVCEGLDTAIDSTTSVDLSRVFNSITDFHEKIVSSGPLKYTTGFADSLPGIAKEGLGIDNTPVWGDKLTAFQCLKIGLLASVAQLPAEFVVKKIGVRVLNCSTKNKKKGVRRKWKGLMKRLF